MLGFVTRMAGLLGSGMLALAMAVSGAWAGGALAYELPVSPALRMAAAVAWGIGVLACMWLWFARGAHTALVIFIVALALVLAWWSTLQPSHERDWADDVSRLPQATVQGDLLVIDGVRNFRWRSDTDYDMQWERREYRLDQLVSMDLILSYWMGPRIAHTLVSFGFADGQRLVLSVEIRKERHEAFSSIGGFFRQFETIIVAANEPDIIQVRSDVRDEDVYLYRLQLPPAQMRALLMNYVEEMQALAAAPRFYNTLTSNCTTLVFDLARMVAPRLPLDYRLLLSGHLDEYVYELGLMTPGYDFATLKARGLITEHGLSPAAFSTAIRRDVPGMQGAAEARTPSGL